MGNSQDCGSSPLLRIGKQAQGSGAQSYNTPWLLELEPEPRPTVPQSSCPQHLLFKEKPWNFLGGVRELLFQLVSHEQALPSFCLD